MFSTVNNDKYNLTGVDDMDTDSFSIITELEQEVNRLIDEARELKAALEDFEMKATAWDYCSKIIKETTDASGITELTLNYRALEYNSGAIQKAKAWDDFEALVDLCGEKEYSLYVDEMAQNPNQVTIDTGHSNKFFYSCDLKVSVSNALKSIKGWS